MSRADWVGPAPRRPTGRCRLCASEVRVHVSVRFGNYIAGLHRPPPGGLVRLSPGGYCVGSLNAVLVNVEAMAEWRRFLSVCQQGRRSPRRAHFVTPPPPFTAWLSQRGAA